MAVKDQSQLQMNNAVAAADAGRDALSGVKFVPQGKQPFDLEANNAFYHLGRASFGFFQVRKDDSSNTAVRVMPGRLGVGAAGLDYPGQAIELGGFNNQTVFLWLYNDAGTPRIGSGVSTAGWPGTPHLKLAEVSIAAGTFEETDIVDRRMELIFKL